MTWPRGSRRAFCAAGLAAIAWPAMADEPSRDSRYSEDFDELWRTLGERYCFFAEKRTDWDAVRALYRPQALSSQSDDAFADVARRVLAELYDPHTHLANPLPGFPRWPLFDLLMERDGSDARVAAVEEGSAAADVGLRIGDRIVAVGGTPIARAVADRMPRCLSLPDPAADLFALNSAVAGRKGQERRFVVQSVGGRDAREVDVPIKQRPDAPDVEGRRLADGSGLIQIRSFGASDSIAAFDRALAEFKDAPGLILDVRGNGGGDTAVARPIMGRFLAERKPYALMRRREGKRLSAPWTEFVEPRGPFTYGGPVVVLADHWSASMAEGFPMGMRGIGRGRIVGTRMMGLGAAVFPIRLDRTGIQAQYSAEPVYDVRDDPRWLLRPDVEVAPGADILAAGVEELRRLIRAEKATPPR